MFVNPSVPSLGDFLEFLSESVQLPADALAPNSDWPGYAYAIALDLIPTGAVIPAPLYVLAVYNLATHYLLMITPDNPDATPPAGPTSGYHFFSNARASFGLTLISLGIATSASDQGTSGSLTLPNWVQNLTLAQLGYLRTPYGQWALQYMTDFGPSVWGLS